MLKATERLERLVSMVPWLIENNGATVEDLASRFQYPRETLINDLTKVLFFVRIVRTTIKQYHNYIVIICHNSQNN